MQCRGCKKWHLMSDHLHWFVDSDKFRIHELLNSGADSEEMKKQFLEMLNEYQNNKKGEEETKEDGTVDVGQQGHTIYALSGKE